MMQPTTDHILAEIRLIARADHACRLPIEMNPYAAGTERAAAWAEGWQAEAAAEHSLPEEMSKLPYFRVRTYIVDGAEKLADLPREEWGGYHVLDMAELPEGVLFESREARARYPGREKVAIRVDYEHAPKGGIET